MQPDADTPSFAEFGEAIGNAGSVVRNNALAAGLDAPVPTCPGWTVLDLLAHLGAVQRWATAIVRGADPRGAGARMPDDEVAARAATDTLDWFDDGQVDLLGALAGAPDDLDVFFFLKNAPPSRLAWCRRQAHEATVHAVDAMAARLGEAPAASQTWFGARLATDGVDELLTGFLPRAKYELRSDTPLLLAVRAADTGQAWTARVTAEPTVATRLGPGVDVDVEADVTITGDAVALYLALWNRGDEVTVHARPGLEDYLATWRERVRII